MKNCYNCKYKTGYKQVLEDVFCLYFDRPKTDIEANEGCSNWFPKQRKNNENKGAQNEDNAN